MKQGPAVRQRGAVLLVLFFSLFALGSTAFLSSVNTYTVQARRQADTRHAMEAARQTLIAYALNYQQFGLDHDGDSETDDEGPGRLPCPDVNNDGLADSDVVNCTTNVRGRLPQQLAFGANTISLDNSAAATDEQFWYVVSSNFREIITGAVNAYSAGTLSVDGTSGYVAVIIAPGPELPNQNRADAPTAAANYLEYDNLAGTSFINAYAADPDNFNDQVIGITFDEIRRDLPMLAAHELSERLDDYYDSFSTYPSNRTNALAYMTSNGPAWFSDNPQDNWGADLSFYALITWGGSNRLAYYTFASCPGVTFYQFNGSDLIKSANACL